MGPGRDKIKQGVNIMKNKLPLNKSILLSAFVMLFFTVLFFFTEKRGLEYTVAKTVYAIFLSITAFLIFYKGEISRYRSIFFITSAISFIIVFKFRLWGATNNIFIAKQPNMPEVPFCHIAMASNLFVTLGDQIKSVFFYGWDKWGFYTLGVLYVFSTLGIGQGFCSWACFYGGIDEAMSKIFNKQAVKLNFFPKRLRDFPLGLWIFFMLASIMLFEPVFCTWACPLKLTTAFLNKGDIGIYKMQIIIFCFIGIVFLAVLPLILKKRTFCSFICPFGAFISVAGQANPYRVRINDTMCNKCGICAINCPMFAITEDYKITSYCVKCGACIDKCPKKAISMQMAGFGIKKQEINKPYNENVHVLFVVSALILGGAISSFFVPDAMIVILKLAGIMH